jgi:hypothetical protein
LAEQAAKKPQANGRMPSAYDLDEANCETMRTLLGA